MTPTPPGVKCVPWLSLIAGGWIPRVSWHDEDGTIHLMDRPDAFTTWQEAMEASRFMMRSPELMR